MNRTPLYLQIARLMRQNIETGRWSYGFQIPSLGELERLYGVSRITIRSALSYLEESDIVQRIRGRGTFVTKDLSKERWYKLPTTLDALVDTVSGLDVRLLHVGQSTERPEPVFAYGRVAATYQRLQRVHYYQEKPYCLIDIYLEKNVYALDPDGFCSNPVIPILVRHEQVMIKGAKQLLRVTVGDQVTASHLAIHVGDPIVDVARTVIDDKETIIYYAQIRYPSKTIQVSMDLIHPS